MIRKQLLLIIITITLLFYLFSHNGLLCEDINQQALIEFKEILQNKLQEIVKTEEFINSYGRSKYKPQFLTTYYIKKMLQPEFIEVFLNNLNFHDLLITQKLSDKELLSKIFEEFRKYVENSIKRFELKVTGTVMLFLIIKPIFLIQELFAIKNLLLNTLTIANTVDLITPEAEELAKNLNKKVFTISVTIIGIWCITSTLIL